MLNFHDDEFSLIHNLPFFLKFPKAAASCSGRSRIYYSNSVEIQHFVKPKAVKCPGGCFKVISTSGL